MSERLQNARITFDGLEWTAEVKLPIRFVRSVFLGPPPHDVLPSVRSDVLVQGKGETREQAVLSLMAEIQRIGSGGTVKALPGFDGRLA